MPQLHLYLPESDAIKIRQRAKRVGLSISQYLAELVKREIQSAWPEGFFDHVVGGWQGAPLQRPAQLPFESRKPLSPKTRRR